MHDVSKMVNFSLYWCQGDPFMERFALLASMIIIYHILTFNHILYSR